MRAILARGSIYTTSLAFQLLSAAVSLPLATRVLPPREYGVVALGYLLLGVTTSVATGGLHLVLGRSYFAEADGPAAARRLITGALIVALVVGAVLVASAPLWIHAFGGVRHRFALVLAILTTMPNAVAAVCGAFFRAADRAARFVTLQLLAGVGGTFAGIFVVALDRGSGATGYWLGNFAAMCAATLLAAIWIRPWLGGVIRARELLSGLRVGLPLVPQGLAALVLALGDRIVIQAREGSAPVGRYQVAYTMGSIALALVTALSMTLPPIIFGAAEHRRWGTLRTTLRAVRMLTAPLAVVLALAGPVLLHAFTPGSYHGKDLAGVVAFVAASALPWAIYGFMTYPLLWRKQTMVIAWTTIVAAVFNVVLVYLLLPYFALPGAASATFAAYWLLAWLLMRASRVTVRVPVTLAECLTWAVAGALVTFGGMAPISGNWLLLRALLTIVALATALPLAKRLIRREDAAQAGSTTTPPQAASVLREIDQTGTAPVTK